MRHQLRWYFWLEAALSAVGFLLGLGALIWPDWIEWTLGVDPDHHSGTLEAVIGIAVIGAALAIGLAARRYWRRAARAASARPATAHP